jgi:two-component system sensor histidine kinase FlrB
MPRIVSKSQDEQTLQAAFEQFNAVSGKLIDAYQQLESQVNVLNAQLDEANSALRQQVSANAALAERLGMLLEALPAGVIELSPQGVVQTENPMAKQMLGQAVSGHAWDAVLDGLEASEIEQTYRVPASERQLTLHYKDLPALGGRLVLLNDVTRLNQLSSELARQQQLAAMGSMAASLAHQLRTPLSTAMLYTANLKQAGLREQDRDRFTDKALARLRALEGLIQNMLGFVRGHVSRLEVLDLPAIVDELTAVFLPPCQAKMIELDCTCSLPSAITVMGDRKALVGALTNLLENALHFSPPGSRVSLRVRCEGESLCLAVEDAGPGIAAENMARLFEPFFTTRSGGTGLGLAIVKKVAQELGGRVSCHNMSTGGACFEVYLPRASAGSEGER